MPNYYSTNDVGWSSYRPPPTGHWFDVQGSLRPWILPWLPLRMRACSTGISLFSPCVCIYMYYSRPYTVHIVPRLTMALTNSQADAHRVKQTCGRDYIIPHMHRDLSMLSPKQHPIGCALLRRIHFPYFLCSSSLAFSEVLASPMLRVL